MTNGKNQYLTVKIPLTGPDTDEFSPFNAKLLQFRVEIKGCPFFNKKSAHLQNHILQDICSDMGFTVIQNLWSGSEMNQGFQYKTVSSGGILYHRIQFSIGKGSGSSLTKLNIGIRI